MDDGVEDGLEEGASAWNRKIGVCKTAGYLFLMVSATAHGWALVGDSDTLDGKEGRRTQAYAIMMRGGFVSNTFWRSTAFYSVGSAGRETWDLIHYYLTYSIAMVFRDVGLVSRRDRRTNCSLCCVQRGFVLT
jgi:hypothetical protein